MDDGLAEMMLREIGSETLCNVRMISSDLRVEH
jgi:hypothetical protein